MKLRTKLILAFFLLAVLPLSGISIYSYNTSLRALRQTVRAESDFLAADMSERMESVNRDLDNRIRRLGAFPFRTLMAQAREKGGSEQQALYGQLMAQMGDVAPFINALEFTPMEPPRPVSPPGPGESPGVQKGHLLQGRRGEHLGRMVIRMGGEGAAEKGGRGPRLATGGIPISIHLEILPPPPPPGVEAGQQGAREGRGRISEIEQLTRKAVEMQAAEAQAAIAEAGIQTSREGREELRLALERNLISEVKTAGETVGNVKAQVSSLRILQHVLSKTQRKQGEIPFALDADGKIYSADPADLPTIQTLPLPRVSREGDAGPEEGQAKNWVMVTKADPNTGVTFGIARPIADRLGEIRRTAARNLALGMAMVGLALIGILPLSSRMTRNLTALTLGAQQLARGNLQTRVAVRTKDEIGQLGVAFNRMAEDLSENQKRLIDQEKLKKELEMCRGIQEDLLPRQSLLSGIVEVKGVSIPAREVGGDFFNYFTLPNGNVGLLVGDVSGKGLPAAILMANLQATIRARLPLESDLAKLAGQLDKEIQEATPPQVYLTLFIAILEMKTCTLHYVNAGHNPQFALQAGGSALRLESTGRPLGLLPGGEYAAKQVPLADGDFVFFYTDGLNETENPAGDEFGTDRLEKILLEEQARGLDGILSRVERAIKEFRGNAEAADDATMMLLKIGNTPSNA